MNQPIFVKGTPADNGDILDFGNYVFSHDGNPTDFIRMVPKCYRQGNEVPDQHYLVKENDRIRAMIGSFPLTMQVLGESLSIAGIGTVSVHPYARGSGYMKKLMHWAQEEMQANNVDLSILGGQRQRYEYFSYTPAGAATTFWLNSSNIRHHLRDLDCSGITLCPIAREDTQALEKCRVLHERQPLFLERSREKFYDILISWNSQVLGIYQGEEMTGYLITTAGHDAINELETQEPQQMLLALKAFFRDFGCKNLSVKAAAFETDKLELLTEFCESSSVGDSYNYAIFHFEPVVRALMRLKASYAHLADGALVLEIKGRETLEICVSQGVPTVSASQKPADLSLDALHATRLLLSASMTPFVQTRLPAFAASWFPLPIYVFRQDGI